MAGLWEKMAASWLGNHRLYPLSHFGVCLEIVIQRRFLRECGILHRFSNEARNVKIADSLLAKGEIYHFVRSIDNARHVTSDGSSLIRDAQTVETLEVWAFKGEASLSGARLDLTALGSLIRNAQTVETLEVWAFKGEASQSGEVKSRTA